MKIPKKRKKIKNKKDSLLTKKTAKGFIFFFVYIIISSQDSYEKKIKVKSTFSHSRSEE